MSDDWIREQAKRHSDEDGRRRQEAEEHGEAERRRLEITNRQFPQLWNAFGDAIRRKSELYNSQYGSQVVYVEVHADRITLRASRLDVTLSAVLYVGTDKRGILSEYQKARGNSIGKGNLPGAPTLWLDGDTLTFRRVPDHGSAGSLTPDDAADSVIQAIVKEL